MQYKNINYLLKHNIYDNITYFPPIGYSQLYIDKYNITFNDRKIYDILFYGNLLNFSYRKGIINNIKDICDKNNYNFLIRDDLYSDNEKQEILGKTKIVLHIPSHKNLHSFPWAKTCELILKRIFFIIEENEEMYIQGLDKICVFYKRNDIDDLKSKIIYYLNNELERQNIIEKLHKYFITKFNIDYNMNTHILNNIIVPPSINCVSIKYKQDNNLRFYLEKQDLYLSIIKNQNKNSITYINLGFYSFGYPKNNFEDDCIKLKSIFEKTTERDLFVFNELDFSNLREFYNYSDEFKKVMLNFFNKSNYILFFCEILINDRLQTKGSDIINEEYAKLLFSNAKKIICCDTKNIKYLSNVTLPDKIIYFPPIGYSKYIYRLVKMKI